MINIYKYIHICTRSRCVSTWHKLEASEEAAFAEEMPPWDPAVSHFLN